MRLQRMTSKDFGKALGLGITTVVALSLVMVPAFRLGLSPLPKPLGLAFAEVVLGAVPLPVGLLFHLVYVTFWSVLYVLLFPRLTFLNALWLALALWGLVLLFFFPVVGWGFLGLGVSPKLIIASLVPDMSFAIALWGLCRWAFPGRA